MGFKIYPRLLSQSLLFTRMAPIGPSLKSRNCKYIARGKVIGTNDTATDGYINHSWYARILLKTEEMPSIFRRITASSSNCLLSSLPLGSPAMGFIMHQSVCLWSPNNTNPCRRTSILSTGRMIIISLKYIEAQWCYYKSYSWVGTAEA